MNVKSWRHSTVVPYANVAEVNQVMNKIKVKTELWTTKCSWTVFSSLYDKFRVHKYALDGIFEFLCTDFVILSRGRDSV